MTDLLDWADARSAVDTLKAEAALLPEGWPENGIPPHPYASINRMMTADERAGLNADIAAHGLLHRIVIFEDKILDGRNRYLECVKLGRFAANVDWRNHPDFVVFGDDRWDVNLGTDPLAFVWGMETRRHNSAKDTALAAARYLRFLAQLVPANVEGQTTKLRLPSQAEIAKRHGVSERLVHSAMMLLERAEPEVVKAVEDGTLSVTDGADVVSHLEPEEQRTIAAMPDRKAVKAAVKRAAPKAKPTKVSPAPELPAPMSRADLANFTEEAVRLATAAVRKHKDKAGASISADALIKLAERYGVLDEKCAFTRPMLLVLGKLRDMPETAPANDTKTDLGPQALPLGGEWTLPLSGFKGKKHKAAIEVFHEADDTYSVRYDWMLSDHGGSNPYQGAYPSFRGAIGVVASWMLQRLEVLGDDHQDKASAGAAARWLREKLTAWGIEPHDENTPRGESDTAREASGGQPLPGDGDIGGLQQGAQPAPRTPSELLAAYAAALKAAEAHRGNHTIKTAEALLRAGVAASITRQKMADDSGIKLGSVSGWCGRLKLQDPARNPTLSAAERAKLVAGTAV